MFILINNKDLFLPVGRSVDRDAEVDQSHAADDDRELAEKYAPAYFTILFRYHTLLKLSSHFLFCFDDIYYNNINFISSRKLDLNLNLALII